MEPTTQKMTICLWYDTQAEEAARFYTSVFKNSQLGRISRFGTEGFEFHHKPAGTVMTVDFSINDMQFLALNGGPEFKFNEAVSVMIYCQTQEEIDSYWQKLTDGGQEGPCGWLKDKFGVSWQIVPAILPKLLTDPDSSKAQRVTHAYLRMKKFDIAALEAAYENATPAVK
ncbi:VOC family protein [Rhodocytophaga rosea]|uniref:VOC family protein n=1 Tax=Rhodocytophaga rosea TaxID=2704465 RepID=A0A6C0GQ25_9BACT|nr:VOC family protein [Rhodocytophaga rosea]QHT69954.1 VOC family protein [Rhodocytophaga rosea]